MSYLVLSWALPNGVSVKEMELAICRSISFIYPSFASLKCLVCQPPIPGLTSTARHHPPAVIHPKVSTLYLIIPYKVFSSWNCKVIRIISPKGRGDYSLKKRVEKERRKSHSPKELQTRSSNKRPNSLPKPEYISLHPLDIPQDRNLVKFQSFPDHHSARQYR